MPALIAAGLLALSVIPTAQAALPDWSLEIDRVDVGTTRLEDVTASSQHQESAPGDGSQEAVMLHVRAITVGESGDSYGPLEGACPGNVLEVGEAVCDGG
jgi:hypothetical protein